jgi:hypothetical protein
MESVPDVSETVSTVTFSMTKQCVALEKKLSRHIPWMATTGFNTNKKGGRSRLLHTAHRHQTE